MVTINSTFNNFSEIPIFQNVFSGFGNEYEYTENEIFSKKNPPQCPKCDNNMVHNGFNSYRGCPVIQNPKKRNMD
ncbi:MAG: hypothetical protein K8R25_04915 [Methanosarcinales archaeon]|nr:hypothetical protein [Methanosarcinales archaeon]